MSYDTRNYLHTGWNNLLLFKILRSHQKYSNGANETGSTSGVQLNDNKFHSDIALPPDSLDHDLAKQSDSDNETPKSEQ